MERVLMYFSEENFKEESNFVITVRGWERATGLPECSPVTRWVFAHLQCVARNLNEGLRHTQRRCEVMGTFDELRHLARCLTREDFQTALDELENGGRVIIERQIKKGIIRITMLNVKRHIRMLNYIPS